MHVYPLFTIGLRWITGRCKAVNNLASKHCQAGDNGVTVEPEERAGSANNDLLAGDNV
jgi:hypothetical protein